nr:PREDICTED: putative disease resistance RPP13-like protein 1 [Musa acuminata subsp. malaccensis]
MAGGIASSIIMWTVDKLRALATTAASSSAEPRKEVEEELRKLQRTMLRIQAELDDSEEQDIRDEPVRLWLSELKDVACDAQDAVEEYEYQVLRAEAESRSRGGGRHKGKHVEVCDYSISAPSRISFPDDLASKVKEIRGSLWELVKVPLLKAGVGKVIVTTRNECVARNMQTMEPLSLNTLPFDKCWMLFEKLALEGLESSSRHNNLVDIGRKIVEKCKGLPLAVKVIARALSYEDDEDKWTDILESERWELVDANLEILPALKISYDYLPIDLKRCFRYLSLFPKDTVLFERYIVHLWMSQGLLRPPRSKQAEDVGSDYVRNLVDRSILQTKVIPGPIYLDPEEEKGLVLHDLVHDLAQSVAQGECLSIAANKLASIFQRDGDKFHKVRHLYLVFDDRMAPRDVKALLKLKRLRTLITNGSRFNEKYCCEFIDELFHNLKYLRALNFSRTDIAGLPDSIGDLKLLRYLSIEGIEIHSLPESICSLYNLQILSLTGTLGLRELPSGIVNLPNIRHLMLSHTRIAVPRGLGKLTYLQTLDCFALGPTSWRIEIEELKGLVNLRGKLIIENLRYVDKSVPQTETPLLNKRSYRVFDTGLVRRRHL